MIREDMRRRGLRVGMIVWLVAVWVLLWGSVSWANLLSGLVVALLISYLLPLPPVPVESRVRPLGLLALVGYVAWSLIWSSTQMAWLAVKPGKAPLNAVLRAHLNIKSDLMLALAVNIINLTPGTIVLEIDQVRRIIYVHVINVGTQRAVGHFYRQIAAVERRVNGAFPPLRPEPSDAAIDETRGGASE